MGEDGGSCRRSKSDILSVCLSNPLIFPFNSIGIKGFFIGHKPFNRTCPLFRSRSEKEGERMMKVQKLVTLAMLTSISYVLMLLNFPFPGFPVFLNVDFSDIPALIAAIIFGPGAGILVEFVKNLLDAIMTGSLTAIPVGHIANFTAGILFVLPTYYVYKKIRSVRGMTFGLFAGTISMAVLMSVLNYYIFLPAYTFFLGAEAMSGPEARTFVTTAILPFNLIKGILITVVFMLIFAKMQTWLNKQALYKNI